MSGFIGPDVIWRADRSWQDRGEEVRLERGDYQGKRTYKLRLMWRTEDGSWRWSQARETSSGKTWADFGLKARELESLGQALLEEARTGLPALDVSQPASAMSSRGPAPSRSRDLADQRFGSGPDTSVDNIPF